MTQSKEIFARNLKRYMDLYGKSQKEMAQIIGVSAPTVHDWLKAKMHPRMEKVELIARYFNITKAELIEEPSASPILLSPVQIGDIIRARREEMALTQDQLAEQAGIAVATIKKWEKGKIAEPRIDLASNLARALDLPLSIIFGVQEDEISVRRQRFRTMLYGEIPDLCLTDDEMRQVINYIKFVVSQRQ